MVMDTSPHTLSDLAAKTGLKPRTAQFLTANQVILADEGTLHGGPGAHRRYSQTELEIATVIAELVKYGIRVGTLRSFAQHLRGAYQLAERLECRTIDDVFDASLKAEVLERPKREWAREAEKAGFAEIPDKQFLLSAEERVQLNLFETILEAKAGKDSNVHFYVHPNGEWETIAGYLHSNPDVGTDENVNVRRRWRSHITIDLAAVLAGL